MGTNTRQYKTFPYNRVQIPGQYVDILLVGNAHPAIAKFFEVFLLLELRKNLASTQLSRRSPVFTGSMKDSVDIRPLSKLLSGRRGARASFKAPYAIYNNSRLILNSWVASPTVQRAAYTAVILAHAEAKRREEKARILRLNGVPAIFTNKTSRTRRLGPLGGRRRGLNLTPLLLKFVGVGGKLIRTVIN